MSSPRDINHFISNLNSLEPMDSSYNEQGKDEELSIFSNTNFFDFDVGRSTNIATTVDDLLMQQERNLQDPKTKLAIGEFINHHYPEAESSKSGAAAGRHRGSTSYHQNHHHHHSSPSAAAVTSVNSAVVRPNEVEPWGFQTLQQFSLASDLSLVDEAAARALLQPVVADNIAAAGPNRGPNPNGNGANTNIQHNSAGSHSYDTTSRENSSSTSNSSHTTPVHDSHSHTATRSNSTASNSRKRKAASTEANNSNDPQSAAEEDKRRRNTEASARFRIKKKIKEQEMERQIRKLEEQAKEQDNRIMELEMENKWLKNLVMEKTEARSLDHLNSMKKQILGEDVVTVKKEPSK